MSAMKQKLKEAEEKVIPHYENIYRQFFQKQKLKVLLEKKIFFYIFVQNLDCRGSSIKYPQSMFRIGIHVPQFTLHGHVFLMYRGLLLKTSLA